MCVGRYIPTPQRNRMNCVRFFLLLNNSLLKRRSKAFGIPTKYLLIKKGMILKFEIIFVYSSQQFLRAHFFTKYK